MSDQDSYPTSAAKVSFVSWVPVSRSAIALILSWLAPFLIMAVGYGFFPALRSSITWPWLAPIEIWVGIVVQMALLIVWILYEIWYTAHRNTSVTQLQTDAFGDLAIAISLSFFLGASITGGTLHWWFIVPMIGALIDVIQSTTLSINNAAEKPFNSPKGST